MTREGRRGVGARRSTARSGGTEPRDPVKGRARRRVEPLRGKTSGTLRPGSVSTKLQRIADLATKKRDVPLTTLAHHIDIEWLREAYRRTRKEGATGVDRKTAKQYGRRLKRNLETLLDQAKTGTYQAPPVRRVYIPKGDGALRPIGIPTFEDKVLQRAVAMALEAVYEQDFLNCSYGFRPGRGAHQALEELREAMMQMHGGWVVEVDISKFFDTLDHGTLTTILRQRIRDGVLLRLIGKWLHAGVLEGRELFRLAEAIRQIRPHTPPGEDPARAVSTSTVRTAARAVRVRELRLTRLHALLVKSRKQAWVITRKTAKSTRSESTRRRAGCLNWARPDPWEAGAETPRPTRQGLAFASARKSRASRDP